MTGIRKTRLAITALAKNLWKSPYSFTKLTTDYRQFWSINSLSNMPNCHPIMLVIHGHTIPRILLSRYLRKHHSFGEVKCEREVAWEGLCKRTVEFQNFLQSTVSVDLYFSFNMLMSKWLKAMTNPSQEKFDYSCHRSRPSLNFNLRRKNSFNGSLVMVSI